MSQRYDVLYLMPEFIKRREAMIRAKPSLEETIELRLKQLLTDSATMQRKKMAGARKNVWRTKLGGGERMIDEPLELPNVAASALLYVDQHDHALAFGKLYNADTVSAISRESVVPFSGFRSVVHQLSRAASQQVETGPTDDVDGIDRSADVDTSAVEPTHAKAVELRVRSPVPGYEEPAAVAITLQDVPSLTRISLMRFLATMSDEQKQLARRPNRNLYVVRGAAGSGKTIIGVRRVEYILRNVGLFDTKPVLVTCYNRVLKNAIETMLEDTLRQPLHEVGVEVKTIFELLSELEREFALNGRVRRKKSLAALLPMMEQVRSTCVELKPLQGLDNEDILAEIDDVIIGRAITTKQAYLDADRSGRGRLPPGAREAIWTIYRVFRDKCDEAGVETWSMLPARVEHHLQKHPLHEPRYAGVIIDEVQDLQPAAVRAVLALQAGSAENVLLLGDAAQSVYRAGFRWKHYGITIFGGQVTTINRCYRSTSPIIRAASSLISAQKDNFEDDLVLPEAVNEEEAPPVRIKLLGSDDECIDYCIYTIAERLQEGQRASAMAVLLDDHQLRRELCSRLREMNIRCEELYESGRRINLAEESVKLLTTYSAKGLEFQSVIMPLVTESQYPTRGVPAAQAARSKRTLYTAMLRAGWELNIFAPRATAAACLEELDSYEVERG
jgi:superfamily I DNA/RNA helicase